MTILPLRRRRTPHAPAVRTGTRPAAGTDADGPPEDHEDIVASCGWHESSAALRAGLVVTEVATADAVAPQVPLGWWLHWQRTAAAGD